MKDLFNQSAQRLNRYIVECKGRINNIITKERKWLNRYIVECKGNSLGKIFNKRKRVE